MPSIVLAKMWTASIASFRETEPASIFQCQCGQKCPREDGLSKPFFITFCEEVKKPLLLAFQRIFSGGRMLECLSARLVCLTRAEALEAYHSFIMA